MLKDIVRARRHSVPGQEKIDQRRSMARIKRYTNTKQSEETSSIIYTTNVLL